MKELLRELALIIAEKKKKKKKKKKNNIRDRGKKVARSDFWKEESSVTVTRNFSCRTSLEKKDEGRG